MLKRFLTLIAIVACCFAFLSCTVPSGDVSQSGQLQSESNYEESSQKEEAQSKEESPSKESLSEESSSEEESEHEHDVVKIEATSSTCTQKGNIECYFCNVCKRYFLDETAEVATTLGHTLTPLLPHNGQRQAGVSPTCGEEGVAEHWACSWCGGLFIDEDCTQGTTEDELVIASLEHKNMEHREGVPVDGEENGVVEHWYCQDCDGYFLDSQGEEEVTKEETVLLSAINIPDFVIEIPSGKEPVVLHLTDTQIIDGSQLRDDVSSGDRITYAPEKIPMYCYDYITEIVQATSPDLILITGDIIYGKYDDNGSVLLSVIAFMEQFKIYWAPVFGNHDNESKMGVDWQCEQLEKAEYCLFKQGNLTGNGNYSVGIKQDGVLKRVFYMLDTNGCTHASDESLQNGHTFKSVGFGGDQVEWYTKQIQSLKAQSPDTKISFAFHIQLAVFGEAMAKYGFDNSIKNHEIYIDYLEDKADGDFGYIGRQMKDAWDKSKNIFKGMKELGVDSIFVGHEHCNSASIVFEGVRLQYGQKSSEYDRYNTVSTEGKIIESAIWKRTGTPLVGGSVIVLSSANGEIIDSYIYYCNNSDKAVNSSFYTK